MANEIPNMSLKQATFNQGSFTPTTYTPQMADMNILANSLSKMEARQEKAAERQGAVDSALAKVESQLHNDKDTQQWFSNYKDNIQKQIQSQVDVGDYGNAIRVATKLADKVMLDPAVQGRLKAEEKYQQEVKTQQARRDKGEISQNTYDWWLSNNPYKYEDNYDSNGNIIGGTDYTPNFRPVADINWAAQAQAAFKMITPYKYSNSRDHAENNNSNGVGTFISTSWHKTHTYEHIKKEDILKNIENLLSATPDGNRQVEQAFDVAMYQFIKMEKEYEVLLNKDPNSDEAKNYKQKLDERRRLMTKNGSPINYKEYYARMVTDNMFAEGLAYDWRTDNTGNSTSTNTNVDNSNGGSDTPQIRQSLVPFAGATYNVNTGYWEGPNVQQTVDTNTSQNVVTQSQSSITNRFNN
jgi:hypothetical protein